MAGEGGAGAHRVCIPRSQNSGAQGKILREFVKNCSPKKGDPFAIRMKGGCNIRNDKRDATGADLSKRQSSNTSFEASSDQLYSFSNMSYIFIPLEDLKNGHYSINAQFTGEVQGISILDSDGEAYYTADATSNGDQIEFDIDGIDDDDPLPAALFVDADRPVSVSYSATATPSAATASPSATTGSGSRLERRLSWVVGIPVVYQVIRGM